MGTLKKIVILHGWTYSLDKWSKFTDLLEKDGFEVYLPKIPGLTQDSNESWNLYKYTNWLNKLLEKYQDKVILLGHSNGGRIAINFAVKYPCKLEKLILIDSAGIFHNELPIRLKRIVFKNVANVGKKFTKSTKSFLVLKGAPTLTFNPKGEVFINTTGNPGMAKFGVGDVLSGILGSFISTSTNIEHSIISAVYLHSLAADLLKIKKHELTYTATDITENLHNAIKFVTNSIL